MRPLTRPFSSAPSSPPNPRSSSSSSSSLQFTAMSSSSFIITPSPYDAYTLNGSNFHNSMPYYGNFVADSAFEYAANTPVKLHSAADPVIDPLLLQAPIPTQKYDDLSHANAVFSQFLHEDFIVHDGMLSGSNPTPTMSTPSLVSYDGMFSASGRPPVQSPPGPMVASHYVSMISKIKVPSTPPMFTSTLGLFDMAAVPSVMPTTPRSAVTIVANKSASASLNAGIKKTQFARKPSPNKSKNHGRRKPEGHIPRPENSFMCFRRSFFKSNSWPEGTDQQIVSRMAADIWNGFDDKEKAEWYVAAAEKKREHEMLFPTYRYKPSASGISRKSGGRKGGNKGPTMAGEEALRLYRCATSSEEMLREYMEKLALEGKNKA